MKKLTPKAKNVLIVSGAAVVCVGVLCAILNQNRAIADSSKLPVAASETSTSTSATVASDVSVASITGNGTVVSGTAGTGSAWTPSSGKSASAPLTPNVSKPKAPTKPTVQGDSKNGKQPINGTLTNKSTKPSYTTSPKAPTQKSTGNGSGSGTTTKKPSGGGSTNGGSTHKSGGGTTGSFDTHKAWGTGGEQKAANDMYEDGTKVGIFD